MKIASATATLALITLPATGTTPAEGRDASRGLPGSGIASTSPSK
ncbi:hypothetical protein [Haloferula sp. BvORR071]|nr:hypothetical protein [Haloferula sp. BvORR071]